MKEQYLDYDFEDFVEKPSEYEEKLKAIQKAYADLAEYKKKELEKSIFRKKILEWKDGIYYILFEKRYFEQYPTYDDNEKVINFEYKPKLEYILYDGNFILKLDIDYDNYCINRTVKCKLPQVDKELEFYNIKLKPEDAKYKYGTLNDETSVDLDLIKINRKLSDWKI